MGPDRRGWLTVKTIFVDCTDQLEPLFAKARTAGDPPIDVNTRAVAQDELPGLLDGYAACLDDHSYFSADVLARCRTLRHIVFLGTGAASYIDLDAAARRGIAVHTIKGYGDVSVAEHAIALMMSAARGIARMDRTVREGKWDKIEGVQLAGRTLGVVGLGGIGREVARIGAGIGMRVIAWNRTPRSDAGVALVELDRLLAEADVVSLHLGLNDATRGFLDEARLARLKPGCILINTARGALIDQSALIRALERGAIAHAGLDVFETEPLPAGHPLTRLDNVTLCPHAGFLTGEAALELLRRGVAIVRDLVAAGSR
jgi:D-3-phosphoglycerate dehydrogenase